MVIAEEEGGCEDGEGEGLAGQFEVRVGGDWLAVDQAGCGKGWRRRHFVFDLGRRRRS